MSDRTPFGSFENAWALLDGDVQQWLLDHRHEQVPERLRDPLLRVGLLSRAEWVGHDGGPSTWTLWPGFEDFLDRQRDAEQ